MKYTYPSAGVLPTAVEGGVVGALAAMPVSVAEEDLVVEEVAVVVAAEVVVEVAGTLALDDELELGRHWL